jgi:hypothetical protein
MVDILHMGDAGWELYEVKGSTSSDKGPYLHDVSVQYYVMSGSGFSVSKAFLVHLNREYVRSEEINIHALFSMRDFTDVVREQQDYIMDELSSMRDMLQKVCPEIDIGTQCISPYDCEFHDYCWGHIPDNSVFDLKERDINKFEYYYKGIIKFKDFDPDDLNYRRCRLRQSFTTKRLLM